MKSSTSLNSEGGGKQFLLVALGLVVLVLAVAVVIIRNLNQTNSQVQEMYSESVRGIKLSGELMDKIQETRLYSLHTLGSTDPNVQLESADASRARDPKVATLLREHAALVAKTDGPVGVRQLEERWLWYLKIRDEVLGTMLEGNREEAIKLDRAAGDAAFEAVHESLDESEAAYSRLATIRLEQIQAISRRNIMTVALMLALVMIGAAAALRALGRNARLLVRSRERFELAVAGSSDGIWDWDIDSGRMYFSPRWKSMIGFEDEEFENTFSRWEEQLHPEDRARVLHVLKDYLEGRSPVFEAEFRLRHKDGNKVWVLSRGAALRDRRGKPYRMAGSQTDITERRRAADEQARLQAQLIQTSRQAGMAEVATGVLHNVGNVLNSVTVSASLLRERLGKSQINNLVKATNLLRDNAADAVAFLTLDPKGQKLPGFIIKLGDHLASEQGAWQEELVGLSKNIEHIKEIVTMQQGFARLSGVTEILDVEELVEDALRINEDGLGRHGIKLVREFQEVPNVEVDKHKVLQILINLIRNAKHALDDSGKTEKSLIVSILTGNKDHVRIQVRDNGLGIAPENLARIFQHGFTTKKDGHGFGLHSGANAAREMGGNLTVHSGGPGMGATFTLVLPVAKTDTLPITKSNQGHSFGQSSPNTSPGTVADI